MISITITAPNAALANKALAAIDGTIRKEYSALWSMLGPMLRDDVRNRIRTHDGGRWQPASKWIRAKSGRSRLLPGQDKNVTFRTFPLRLEVIHVSPGKWGINQHDQGFTENPTGLRVSIPIRDAAPLGLPSSAKVFSFISKRPSVVPARKIWPEFADVRARVERTTSLWMQRTIRKVPGVQP